MDKKQALKILQDFTHLKQMQKYLLTNYSLDPKGRIKRGELQRDLASHIGYNINVHFYKLIKELEKNAGLRRIRINGEAWYKGITK